MRKASKSDLKQALQQVRNETLAFVSTLGDEVLASHSPWQVPYIPEINPPMWEFAHLAWFQEYWCVRHFPCHASCVRDSILVNADALLDSAIIGHRARWLPQFSDLTGLQSYMSDTLELSMAMLDRAEENDQGLYFFRLALFHEQMHLEAFAMNWQTLGYRLPSSMVVPTIVGCPGALLDIAPGAIELGSQSTPGFVFDNEKWAHSVTYDEFRIDSELVTNAQYIEFLTANAALSRHANRVDELVPRYWSHASHGKTWQQMQFGHWIDVDLSAAVVHVSQIQAQAYCEWKGGFLPSEVEWLAAIQQPGFAWGNQAWEWTASVFDALPGFSADPYKEYSQPWFGDHWVVKGASIYTSSAMRDSRYRNFYQAHRADPFIGFRVCYKT